MGAMVRVAAAVAGSSAGFTSAQPFLLPVRPARAPPCALGAGLRGAIPPPAQAPLREARDSAPAPAGTPAAPVGNPEVAGCTERPA